MKVKTVSYSMLRVVTAKFENDRVEVAIELDDGESATVAIAKAKRLCQEALGEKAKRAAASAAERELELD